VDFFLKGRAHIPDSIHPFLFDKRLEYSIIGFNLLMEGSGELENTGNVIRVLYA
jgi:hypothetical protein